jgi:hypothetical protein
MLHHVLLSLASLGVLAYELAVGRPPFGMVSVLLLPRILLVYALTMPRHAVLSVASLGVLAYELAVGRPPFHGECVVAKKPVGLWFGNAASCVVVSCFSGCAGL